MSTSQRKLLLLSSSAVHGHEYLQYAANELHDILTKNGISRILFIPYALREHDDYMNKIRRAFENIGYKVDGIHTFSDPVAAVTEAQAFYVGGGNTFQLLKCLYDKQLLDPIRKRVLQDGVPYIGSSAGSNVATASICTTNDMPIVYPPSFSGLKLVPFNINPHYIDADFNSKHHGETREERIRQYHEIPGAPAVLGMREGCLLSVEDGIAQIKGLYGARLFRPGKEPEELPVGSDVSFLLQG